MFPAKDNFNDRRHPNIKVGRNSARAAGAASAAHAARAVCDSYCVSGAVTRSNDWHRRFVQPDRGTICRRSPRDGRDPSVATANKRRYPASAKTAIALLAHYFLVQALWNKRTGGAAPGCAGGRRFGCLDFFDWGKDHRLLARFYCGSDLPQLLRHIFASSHCDARTARQRVYGGHDFLRVVRLSAPASTACVVRRFLGLFGVRLPYQRFARRSLSGGDFSIAVDLLPRSAVAISRAFAMGIFGDLLFNRSSLAHLGAMEISGVLSLYYRPGMGGSSMGNF